MLPYLTIIALMFWAFLLYLVLKDYRSARQHNRQN